RRRREKKMSYTVAKGNQRVDPDQVGEAGKIPEGVVDLRSDTVTRPTPEMRRAMAEAEVGDDVYGEDPTVNRLERRAAEIFGKEAALFVPTGCMGNLICIKVWTHHGDEVICEERSHVNLYELASMSAIAGCMPRATRGEDGILTWKQIEAVIRPNIYYDSQTALVCLENTSNMAGGTVYPTAQVEDICDHAHALGLKVHLDGARIFNAAAALGDNVAQMTRSVDSVMVCLSKGLGAEGASRERLWCCRMSLPRPRGQGHEGARHETTADGSWRTGRSDSRRFRSRAEPSGRENLRKKEFSDGGRGTRVS